MSTELSAYMSGVPTSLADLRRAYAHDGKRELAGDHAVMVQYGIGEIYKRGITNTASIALIMNVPMSFVEDTLVQYRTSAMERFLSVDLMRAELLMELEGIQLRLHETLDFDQVSPAVRTKILRTLIDLVTQKGKLLGLHESRVLVKNEKSVNVNIDDPDGMATLAGVTGVPEEKLRDLAGDIAEVFSKEIPYGT